MADRLLGRRVAPEPGRSPAVFRPDRQVAARRLRHRRPVGGCRQQPVAEDRRSRLHPLFPGEAVQGSARSAALPGQVLPDILAGYPRRICNGRRCFNTGCLLFIQRALPVSRVFHYNSQL